jgi:mRNA interferase RelE/StbE
MASYEIEWKRSAVKDLKELPKEMIVRILRAVEALAENPLPPSVKKMVGSKHTYRLREGDYRVIYDLLSKTLVIEIIRIGHRKDVYD